VPSPGSEAERARLARGLAVVLYAVAALLTVKTAWDLYPYRRMFPGWFVPAFAFGTCVLVGYGGWVAWRLRSAPAGPGSGTPARSGAIWLLFAASFVCTTGVHSFLPFRPVALRGYAELADYPVLVINFALALVGLASAVVLWRVHRSGRTGTALLGVVLLGFLMLVPNDTCANPFNSWWLRTLGASPLMYVPNMYAGLFAVAALEGVDRRLNTAALAAVCVSTALLGLGHMSRVIW
jgi:hypothetical protein